MNIKSNQRSNPRQLAVHLVSDENESIKFTDSRSIASQNVIGALAEMEALIKGSRAQKPLYHVQYSPQPNQP